MTPQAQATRTPDARGARMLTAAAIGGALYLAIATCRFAATAGTLLVLLRDLPVALLIFVAAAGWGRLFFSPLTRADQAGPLLHVATWTALGGWLLSTAMLIAGTLVPGGLSPLLWRVVCAAGAALALVPLLRFLNAPAAVNAAAPERPRRFSPLTIVAVAGFCAAAGFWTAGAVLPPGQVGVVEKDFYDVESYHLQIPREYYDNGRIDALPHNTYANYPLGGEMLFLLAMCLKGGAWAGLYAAKLTHGLWGVTAILAVTGCVGPGDRRGQLIAALLAASSTMAVYLGWLAFVELAQCALLAVAMAWLTRLRESPLRVSLLIGLSCGAACAFKYLSVGLVAAPVAVAYVVILLRSGEPGRLRRLLIGVAAATLAATVAFGPWLARNLAYTGNPVFPLETRLLGRGHWNETQQARWDAAHAPRPWRDKLADLPSPALSTRGFGWALSTAAAIGAATLMARVLRKDRRDDLAPAATALLILVLQLLVWMLATHMPARFMAPALAPVVVLAAWGLSRLPDRVRLPVACLLAAAGLGQAMVALSAEHRVLAGQWPRPALLAGITAEDFKDQQMQSAYGRMIFAPGAKLLLVGDVRPLYCPPGTLYASAWEIGPLVAAARRSRDPEKIIAELEDRHGITLVQVNRPEIARLRSTVGWWSEIDQPLIDSLKDAGAGSLDVFPEYSTGGLPAVELLILP